MRTLGQAKELAPARAWLMVAAFAFVPLLFSSNMLMARLVVAEVPPVTLAFGRWLVAALVLVPLVARQIHQHRSVLRAAWVQLAIMAFLGAGVAIAPQYLAAQHTSAGNMALMFAVTPLLVMVLERLGWGAPLSPRGLLGIGIAVCGLALAVFRGEFGALSSFSLNPGDLLVLAAAAGWAGYTAMVKRHPLPLPPLVSLAALAAGGAAGLAPFAVWEAGNPLAVLLTPKAGGAAVFLALVASIAAYRLYGAVVMHFGAARAAMAMYLVPFYTLVLAALLLGESLRLYHGAALALTLLGVAVGTVHFSVRKRLDTPPIRAL